MKHTMSQKSEISTYDVGLLLITAVINRPSFTKFTDWFYHMQPAVVA